jgi:hypothetical protein
MPTLTDGHFGITIPEPEYGLEILGQHLVESLRMFASRTFIGASVPSST